MNIPRKAFQATIWSASRAAAVLRHGAADLLSAPPGNVPGLDLLRSLAIILVVSGHYFGEFTDARKLTLGIGRFPLFYFSWTGVDLFFVLSGFLIGGQLWRQLVRTNSINVPRFLLRRGLRIWPFYFAFLISALLTSSKPAAAFLPDLFFVSNYLPNAIAGGWSLSIEEQFYIFVPLLLLGLNKLLTVQRQVIVIVALLFALPVVRFLTLAAHSPGIDQDELRRLIQFPFHTHADGLLAGLLLSWVSVLRAKYLAPLSVRRNLVLPLLLAAAGLLLRALDPHVFGFCALALIFGGFTLFALRDRSWFTRLARLRIFYITSRLSYGMYLNHFPLLIIFVPLFVSATISAPPYVSFFLGYPLAVLVSMLVSAATFVVIESPFLQLRERWLARRSAAT